MRSMSSQFMQSIKHKITDAGKLIHLYKEELHTARVSLFIVVFVFFCWLPYFLATLLTKFNYQPAVEYSRETWWHGSIFIMIALYTVLSPCVFAFRCKRLHRRVKKYYRCRIR